MANKGLTAIRLFLLATRVLIARDRMQWGYFSLTMVLYAAAAEQAQPKEAT